MTKHHTKKPAGNAKGSHPPGPKKVEPRVHAAQAQPRLMYNQAEQQVAAARTAAAVQYLRALSDPRGMQPMRAPDNFMHPTAVWKTVLVKRVKVQGLVDSGSAAPNHGVLGYAAPGLSNSLVIGTSYGGSLGGDQWLTQTIYPDPTYNNGITNATMYGYRCTAMSVSFDTTASSLVAAGSLRVLCIAGAPGSPDAFTTVTGRKWGVLDTSKACVLDPRRSDLGELQFCWSWANTNDMTYVAPDVGHYGPVIVFELGTEEAKMEFNVTVTKHYQGLPSLQQQMIMETQSACVATWDDVNRVRDVAAVSAHLAPATVQSVAAAEEDGEEKPPETWHSKLARGLSHFRGGPAAGVMGVLGDIASDMLPGFLDGDDEDETEATAAAKSVTTSATSGANQPFRGMRR